MTIVKRSGKVTAFDLGNARGEVQYGGERTTFFASSFDAGRPPRYPREGDQVDVVLSETAGNVLWIRLKS